MDINFLFAFFGNFTDGFRTGDNRFIYLDIFEILISTKYLHDYNLRNGYREMILNDNMKFKWKAWKTYFKNCILEIYIEIIFHTRKITVLARRFKQLKWKTLTINLRENQTLLSAPICIKCQTKRGNCENFACGHFYCLECVYELIENITSTCDCCGFPISAMVYYASINHKPETVKRERIYTFCKLLKVFLSCITNQFQLIQQVTFFNTYKMTVECTHDQTSLNSKYIFKKVFS